MVGISCSDISLAEATHHPDDPVGQLIVQKNVNVPGLADVTSVDVLHVQAISEKIENHSSESTKLLEVNTALHEENQNLRSKLSDMGGLLTDTQEKLEMLRTAQTEQLQSIQDKLGQQVGTAAVDSLLLQLWLLMCCRLCCNTSCRRLSRVQKTVQKLQLHHAQIHAAPFSSLTCATTANHVAVFVPTMSEFNNTAHHV